MSLSYVPLELMQSRTPTTDINSKREYVVLKGGKSISVRPYSTQSFSDTNTIFNIPISNKQTIYGRRCWIRQPVRLIFTCTEGANLCLQANYDSFREFPLASCMQQINLKMGNFSTGYNMSDIIHGLLRYSNEPMNRMITNSQTPTMQDNYQEYFDAIGSARNPLGSYGNSSFDFGRGSVFYTNFTNTTTGAQIDAVIVEPIMLSPLLWNRGVDGAGMIGIDDFELVITWGNLQKLWSHAGPKPLDPPLVNGWQLASASVNFQPDLLIEQVLTQDIQQIPRNAVYSYYQVVPYSTDINELIAPNAFKEIVSNSIELNSIPNRVYIFAKKKVGSIASPAYANLSEETDTFFRIEKISINYNTVDGILSSASEQDLYNISASNFLNNSWYEWHGVARDLGSANEQKDPYGLVGSVLCLRFAKDIGLSSDKLAPGQLFKTNFQIQVTVRNVNQARSLIPTLWVVFVNEGTFSTLEMGTTTYSNIGVVSAQDVLNAEHAPYVAYSHLDSPFGGNFLDSLKKFGKQAYRYLREHKPISKGLKLVPHPYAQIGSQVADVLGFGEGARVGGELYGDIDYEGDALVGGKKMSKRKLKERLRYL